MTPDLPDDFQTAHLAEVDPESQRVLDGELGRQQNTLEMIASENFVPQAVLDAAGSVLTNKYAEGYPGKRYYGGCEWVDIAEQLAIDRAKEVFGAEHANVQPHAGAQANNAAYMAMIDPGDTIMGMALDHGGHLTHGMKLNVSGKLYDVVAYHVRREDKLVRHGRGRRLAEEHKPKVIVAGWSAYPRQLDFAAFREIADSVGAKLMVDMAHFAGLVAAGEHPSPVPHADVVTTTIHKTIGGPRSGMILCKEELAADINRSVFPGQQGGPLMHIIAAKAVALRIAQSDQFKERQRQTIANAQAFADELIAGGIDVLTGGTDVHLVLVDLTNTGLDGKTAEDRLEEVGITVNRNAIPFDERPPMNPSGLRIGTPALTTRGLVEDDLREVAKVIVAALGRGLRFREGLAPGALPRADGALPALPRALRGDGLTQTAVRIWADMSAPAHVLVLRPIIERLRAQGHEVLVTSRDYAQTQELLALHRMEHTQDRQARRGLAGQQAGQADPAHGRDAQIRQGKRIRPGDRARLQRHRDRLALARHSRGEHARLRVRGPPASRRVQAGEAGDLSRLRAARAAEEIRRRAGEAVPISGFQGGVLSRRLRGRPRRARAGGRRH